MPIGPFTAEVQRALGFLPTAPTTSLPTSMPIGSLYFDTTANLVKVSTDGSTWTSIGGTFTGGTITTPILAANGTVNAPTYSFTAATNTGWFYASPYLEATVAGTAALFIGSSFIFSTNNGTAANPGFALGGNASCGMWSPTANTEIALAAGGFSRYQTHNKTLSNTSATPQNIFTIATTSNSGGGGTFIYTVIANDGTNWDAESGTLNFAWVNKAGAGTAGAATSPGGTTAATGSGVADNTGTLVGTPSVSFSGTTLQVVLTPTWATIVPTNVICRATIINHSDFAVTNA